MQRGLSCLVMLLALVWAAPSSTAVAFTPTVSGGNAHRGAKLIANIGCGACHTIPGISGADGRVGPPLAGIGDRVIIAGVMPNTPSNLIAWLKNPQVVIPGNAMPNLGLTDNEARDIAAYLYSLR